MEYRRFGEQYMIRIDRGEEVLEQLTLLCRGEKIRAGEIVGLGACDQVTMGLYNVARQSYTSRTFEGEFEITNLTGSVSEKEGEVYLHLHITCSGEDFSTFGGHLNACRISGTCELWLTALDGEIGRRHDEVTGLNVYDFLAQRGRRV